MIIFSIQTLNSRILNIICVFQMLEMFSRHGIIPGQNPLLYFEVIVQVFRPVICEQFMLCGRSYRAGAQRTWYCFCKLGVLFRYSLKMQIRLNFSKTILFGIGVLLPCIAEFADQSLCWVHAIIILSLSNKRDRIKLKLLLPSSASTSTSTLAEVSFNLHSSSHPSTPPKKYFQYHLSYLNLT